MAMPDMPCSAALEIIRGMAAAPSSRLNWEWQWRCENWHIRIPEIEVKNKN
jgi:hypothetical protein